MNRFFKVVLVFVLTLSLFGCNGETNKKEETKFDIEKSAQVVIVGAGGAGLSAAVEAVANGATSVILLEKTGVTGGSLNYTSGSMSGAETIIQSIDGVEDSKESYVQDILNNGAHKGNETLIRAFVEEDVDAIQWLWNHGLSDNKFSVDRITGTMSVFASEHQLYSQKRTYKPSADDATKYKSAVHEVLDQYVATLDNVSIEFNTEAFELVYNKSNQVTGVLAKQNGQVMKYTSEKGVIMATGRYSGNLKLMAAFTENGGYYLPGGADSADGYGIYMMQQIGANIDADTMSYVPTFPMGLDTGNGPGKIASTYMWKTGDICVNKDGKRFVDETEAEVVARETALEKQPEAIQYDIFTDKIIEDTGECNINCVS